MDKSVLDELIEAKHERDTALVCFFNTGKVRTDEVFMLKYMNKAKLDNNFYLVTDTLKEAIKAYSHFYEFDSVKTPLELGLIYEAKDVDKDNQIKENAEPMDGFVRFYTGPVDCYLGDEQTNKHDCWASKQSFITFDKLMKSIKNSGLVYEGPTSFDELKTRILNNEQFDITISASLVQKEEKTKDEVIEIKEVVEEKPVEKKSKVLSLFKR